MPTIAISYRRSDTAGIVGRIHDRLSEQFGPGNVFIDIDAIPYGIDFRDHIATVLSRADAVLVVVGPRWLGVNPKGRRIDDPNDPVRVEVQAALARRIPVIPVLVDGAEMPSADDLPEDIRAFAYRNAAEIDVGRDFRAHTDRLIRSLEALGGPSPATGVSLLMSPDPPTPAAPPARVVAGGPPQDHDRAAETYGGYSRSSAGLYEGTYQLYRWSFSREDVIFRGILDISWDEAASRLVFEEFYESGRDGPDDVKSMTGDVFISPYSSLVHLMTVVTGSVRSMTLTKIKQRDNVMRGILSTQSDALAFFRPTVSSLVLRKVPAYDRSRLVADIDVMTAEAEDHAFAREQLLLTERDVLRLRFGAGTRPV